MNKTQEKINLPRVNKEIPRSNTVRLIYKENNNTESENDFNKVVSWNDAIRLANNYGLDLIELNAKTDPPIIRLADYNKYVYSLKKKAKAQLKNKTIIKEIQLSANISEHDLEIKARKALEFIEKGDKVKVVLSLKGRELTRREESKQSFYKFLDIMIESGKSLFDTQPRDEAKKTYVILKKKQ